MDTNWYRIWFALHIISIVAAMAGAVVYPMLFRELSNGGDGLQRFAGIAQKAHQRIHGTALVLAGLFGIFLLLASHEAWKFDQTWISLALLVWVAMLGVLHALIVPAERQIAAGSGDAQVQQRLQIGATSINLMFLLMLYLMIWKPGA